MVQKGEILQLRGPNLVDFNLVNSNETHFFKPSAEKQVIILALLLERLGYHSILNAQDDPVFKGGIWLPRNVVKIRNNFHADFPDSWLLTIFGIKDDSEMSFDLKLEREELDPARKIDTARLSTAEVIMKLLEKSMKPREFGDKGKFPDLSFPEVSTFDLSVMLNPKDLAHGIVVNNSHLVTGFQFQRAEGVMFDPISRYGTISLLSHPIRLPAD